MDYRIRHCSIAGALALTLFSPPAMAAGGAASAASMEVLESIQYSVLLDMNFGKIAASSAGGVIVLDPGSGTRSCDPGLVCAGTSATSQLQLTGSDANVAVSFAPTFQLTGPGDPILAEPLFPGGSGSVIHLTGGTAVAYFGARITIAAGQLPGLYSGTFAVNLEYQ